jgi:iron complex outermembrane receptor protein
MTAINKHLMRTVGACALMAGGWGHAQSNSAAQSTSGRLETVVVTAERHTANVQKTAASISVRSGRYLKEQGKTQIQDILEDVPGVVYTGNGAAGTQPGGPALAGANITIRGIQSNSSTGGSWLAAAPAAAVYVDDVYEGLGDNYDLNRVEVLRGPQGTLYGRSATSGVVAIHTTDPSLTTPSADVSAELGNYRLQHYSGGVNIPLIENELGLRVAADQYQRDGYYSAKGGQVSITNVKGKLLFKPTPDVSVLLGAAVETNGAYSGGVGPNVNTPAATDVILVPALIGAEATTRSHQYWANINWNFGFGNLTYIPALHDVTVYSPHAVISGPGFDAAVANFIPQNRYITQEVRLASNPGAKVTWQAGALYYGNTARNQETVTILPAGPQALALQEKKDTIADGVFAEATYPITPSWRLNGGLRYDYTRSATVENYTSIIGKTKSLYGPAGVRDFNNFTYKLRTEHDLSPANMVYAVISSGFSPGDVEATTGAGFQPVVVVLKAETLTAYEIGSKNRFLDNRLQINGDIYYYDYSGYQTAGISVSGNPSVPSFATLTSPLRVLGSELETQYLLTPNDRISADAALTDPRYTGASAYFKSFVAQTMVAHVVPVTLDASYTHSFDLTDGSSLALRGDARYLSAHAAGNLTIGQLTGGAAPLVWQPPVVIADLGATWASAGGRYNVTGYVRNVGNTIYKTDATPNTNINGSVYLSDPRTYGVVISVHL